MSEPATPPATRAGRPVVTTRLVLAGICLVIPFVAMLWVSSYARLDPAFLGIPFFYWYQMAWVIASTVLTATAYRLVRWEQRARKESGR